jgi:sec-independent protein translocase protein TatB
MFDIGWSELMVVGVIALLVVGPKDLPRMFRTVGQYVNKARSMAREFQRNMEDAAKDTGMEDVAKAARSMQNVTRIASGGARNIAKLGLDSVTGGVTKPAPAEPAAAAPAPAAPEPVATVAAEKAPGGPSA